LGRLGHPCLRVEEHAVARLKPPLDRDGLSVGLPKGHLSEFDGSFGVPHRHPVLVVDVDHRGDRDAEHVFEFEEGDFEVADVDPRFVRGRGVVDRRPSGENLVRNRRVGLPILRGKGALDCPLKI